jgi:hypothetical protein
MSEPYSILTRATITEDALRAYLSASVLGARHYLDWKTCRGFLTWGKSAEELAVTLGASLDSTLTTHAASFREFRCLAGEGRLGRSAKVTSSNPYFRFFYDRKRRQLTQASYWFSDESAALVRHLTVCRGLSSFMSEGEAGSIAVHDPFIGNGTVTVIALRSGASEVVYGGMAGETLRVEHKKTIREIVAELTRNAATILEAEESETFLVACERLASTRDELDAWVHAVNQETALEGIEEEIGSVDAPGPSPTTRKTKKKTTAKKTRRNP